MAIMTVKVVLLVLVSLVAAAPEIGAVFAVGVASTDWISVMVGIMVLTEAAAGALAMLSVSEGAEVVLADSLAIDEAADEEALALEALTEAEAESVTEALAVVDADADVADCEADAEAEADVTDAEALVTEGEALAEAEMVGIPAAPATGGRMSARGSSAGKGDRFFMRRLLIMAWSRAWMEASWHSTRATKRERYTKSGKRALQDEENMATAV